MASFLNIIKSLHKKISFSANNVFQLWVILLKAAELILVCSLLLAFALWGLQKLPTFHYFRQWIPLHSLTYPRFIGFLHFSLVASTLSLTLNLLVGALMRLLYITRFIYDLLGFTGRLFLIWTPYLFLLGWFLSLCLHSVSWQTGIIIGMVSCIILFNSCIELAEKRVPELIPALKSFRRRCYQQQNERATNPEQPISEARNNEQYFAEILDLTGNESLEQIRQKYHKKARSYHPDKVLHLGKKIRIAAEQEMKEINRAYSYFEKKHKR